MLANALVILLLNTHLALTKLCWFQISPSLFMNHSYFLWHYWQRSISEEAAEYQHELDFSLCFTESEDAIRQSMEQLVNISFICSFVLLNYVLVAVCCVVVLLCYCVIVLCYCVALIYLLFLVADSLREMKPLCLQLLLYHYLSRR